MARGDKPPAQKKPELMVLVEDALYRKFNGVEFPIDHPYSSSGLERQGVQFLLAYFTALDLVGILQELKE